MKLRYYLNYHGDRTSFCTVIHGKMTSQPGRRLHTSDGHRTILVYFNCAFNGIDWASYDFWKTQGRYLTNRPMPVQAPADVLWVELPVKSDIVQVHRFFISKDQNYKYKHIFRFSSWGWITCNDQVLLKCNILILTKRSLKTPAGHRSMSSVLYF